MNSFSPANRWKHSYHHTSGISVLTAIHSFHAGRWLEDRTTLLTYSMEQSPSWEDIQEIHCILRNPMVYYSIHKCPPPVPILSQLDPVHKPTSYFLKIHLIFPSKTGSPKCSLSLRFPHQNPLYASSLPHMRYMPCPSHSSRLYHLHNIGWGVQVIKLLIM